MAGTLEKGIYIQVYRDKIPGKDKAAKMKSLGLEMDKWKALGVRGVAWHGFVGDLDKAKFAELTKLCKDRGMLSLAAYGLGSTRPVDYGNWIGDVANAPDCAAVVLDMEGAWEDEAEDKAKAKLMGVTLRAKAPNVLVIDQPWPIPTYHWSLFPWEETSAYVDIRAPQIYTNNFRKQWGKDAYEKFWAWHTKDWAKLETRLAPKGLVKPKIPSIQGYFWLLEDAINCVCSNDTMIVWSEPYPEKEFLKALEVVNKLKSLGHIGPNAVAAFQTANNLDVDNNCGPLTMAKLGIPLPK